MAWNRRWLGASLIGMSGWVLTGCASDLPDYAQPRRSLALEMSEPSTPTLVRMQTSDGPAVKLEKPLIAPPGFNGQQPDPPIIMPPPPPPVGSGAASGAVPASLTDRGKVRVRVRAWVNCRPIFDEEVMQLAGPELRRVYSLPASQVPGKMTELLNTVIDQLVDQELMYQDAVKKLEKASPKALEKMREYVDQEYDKTVERMRKSKVPEEQIREIEPTARRMMERNLISTEYARSRIKPALDNVLGMREIREYYETHLNEFRTVDKLVWQDIYIPTSANLPTVEDVKRFAEDLINKCRMPDDFNRLMVYDDSKRGGEGFGTRRGEIQPRELEEPLFKLREGEIGPVMAFPMGVHLIRVTKREYDGQMPLDDKVQKLVRKKLESELADREYRRIVRELRLRAVVRLERELP
jgi:hypothetical protein